MDIVYDGNFAKVYLHATKELLAHYGSFLMQSILGKHQHNRICSFGFYRYYYSLGGIIRTFSLSISLSITLRTSKFRNQFTISSRYFELVSSDVISLNLKRDRARIGLSFQVTRHLLRFSEMTSELITFNHLRCHSSSTALGTRTGY